MTGSRPYTSAWKRKTRCASCGCTTTTRREGAFTARPAFDRCRRRAVVLDAAGFERSALAFIECSSRLSARRAFFVFSEEQQWLSASAVHEDAAADAEPSLVVGIGGADGALEALKALFIAIDD